MKNYLLDRHITVVTCGKATKILQMLMRTLKKSETKTRITAFENL